MGKHRSAGGRAPSGRGKHRKPTTTGRNAARVAVAGVVLSAPTMMGAGVANAQGGFDRASAVSAGGFDHDAIIACESGGDARAQNSSSSASGLYQFIDSTWRAYGGSTSSAKDASVSEQRRVAERLFAAEGYSPWNASKSCWSGKIGSGGSVSISNGDTPRKSEAAPKKSATKSESRAAAPEKKVSKAAVKQDAPAKRVAPKAGNGRHTVVSGETLSGLALRYTGDSWQELYERNRDVVGANPHHIVPGQVLEVRK